MSFVCHPTRGKGHRECLCFHSAGVVFGEAQLHKEQKVPCLLGDCALRLYDEQRKGSINMQGSFNQTRGLISDQRLPKKITTYTTAGVRWSSPNPTTNLPVSDFTMGERTRPRVFHCLWSYILNFRHNFNYVLAIMSWPTRPSQRHAGRQHGG